MKVFISGPLLTKTKEANIKAYLDAARAIKGQGHTALYPFDITQEENDCCNRKNIRKHLQLLLKADVVLFLYNWYNDARCRIINSVATEMDIHIFYLDKAHHRLSIRFRNAQFGAKFPQ